MVCKNQNDVRKLIAGPSVYICNECIDLCNDIIKEEISEKTVDTTFDLSELKEDMLDMVHETIQKVYLSLVGNIHPVTTKDMEAIERILSKCVNRMK